MRNKVFRRGQGMVFSVQLNFMQSLLIFIFSTFFISSIWAADAAPDNKKEPGSFSITEKPSLKNLGQQLKDTSAITLLYRESKDLLKLKGSDEAQAKIIIGKIDQIWKSNATTMANWTKYNQESTPFQRTEIEEESVMNNLLAAVQLSSLKARAAVHDKQWSEVKKNFEAWMIFASDTTYEEASLISLRLANVIRSLIFDELETIENLYQQEFPTSDLESWLAWVNSIRSSWPIDRVLITESKKIMGNKPMYTAQQVAIALQKNAYQTAAVALKAAQGPKTPELKMLEKMWRDEDILAMKTEVHRLSALRIRLAKDLFVKKYSQEPKDIQDLVSKHLLAVIPIDYNTGKSFTLAEAALH